MRATSEAKEKEECKTTVNRKKPIPRGVSQDSDISVIRREAEKSKLLIEEKRVP